MFVRLKIKQSKIQIGVSDYIGYIYTQPHKTVILYKFVTIFVT